MLKVLGIGINVVDIYVHQGKMYPGGNEYNICYHLSQMGVRTAFMGVFANDEVGKILSELLIRNDIDISHSKFKKGSSGYALVDIVDGDRVFLDWNRQGVTDIYPFEITDEEIKYIKKFDAVCISYASRLTYVKIKKLSDSDITLSYDFSDCFSEEIIESLCPLVTFAFFSCSNVSDQSEIKRLLRKAVSLGPKIAVATMGSDGALAYDGGAFYRQEAIHVSAIDTMGAGDSFIAAFLRYYLVATEIKKDTVVGDNIKTALREGGKLAALTVQKNGALGIGYSVDVQDLGKVINI